MTDIWIDDNEANARYPFLLETRTQLITVLQRAVTRGVTDAEIASLLATLHALAIVRLQPDETQLKLAVSTFQQALVELMTRLKAETSKNV